MRTVGLLVGVSLLLAGIVGCSGGALGGARAPNTFDPDPNLVSWVRDPHIALFTAAVIGGVSDQRDRNTIPDCAIYGDNRIVWTNLIDSSTIEVLEDRVGDPFISQFIQYLTVAERIYTYDAGLPAIRAANPDATPVAEQVRIFVSGIEHRADSFGTDGESGWDEQWYPRVVEFCRALAQSPVLVAPSAGWVSAVEVPLDVRAPLAVFDADAFGITLAALAAGDPIWASGSHVADLWRVIHTTPSNLLFDADGRYYALALQVPGVTLDAPPPA